MRSVSRSAICAALAVALLDACSHLPSRDAPRPIDSQAIPDAVPRNEPRSRFGNPSSYEVFGQRYDVLASASGYLERGKASWYGPGFHGERTSSGETYNMYAMTAAHKTLPIPVYAQVTNLNNGRSVVVRINDRGPFVGDRLIDLSWSAAARLDMLRDGTAPVEVRVLSTPTSANPTQTGPAATEFVNPLAADATARSFLQLASFADVAYAQHLVQQLADAGIRNAVVREAVSAGHHVWRVRVGPIASRLELDDYTERLTLIGIPDARLAHD